MEILKEYCLLFGLAVYPTYEFDSKQFLYPIGNSCASCNKVITGDCITVCNCFRFTHQKCLIKELSKQPVDPGTRILCKECKKPVFVDFKWEIRVGFRFLKMNVFLSFLFLILWLLFAWYQVKNPEEESSDIIIRILITVIIFISLILSALPVVIKTEYRMQKVHKSAKSMETSAFKEIEMSQQQGTQMGLIKKSSKK